ncbi:MAG: hypothetical protein LBV79_11265 [Candidatus Adiutrix sp.]|jgi:uncharacterized membrane protein|nr:hypothetical protein [Candidatus Adiutrix sp.]
MVKIQFDNERDTLSAAVEPRKKVNLRTLSLLLIFAAPVLALFVMELTPFTGIAGLVGLLLSPAVGAVIGIAGLCTEKNRPGDWLDIAVHIVLLLVLLSLFSMVLRFADWGIGIF